jgi:hypothetical protein
MFKQVEKVGYKFQVNNMSLSNENWDMMVQWQQQDTFLQAD